MLLNPSALLLKNREQPEKITWYDRNDFDKTRHKFRIICQCQIDAIATFVVKVPVTQLVHDVEMIGVELGCKDKRVVFWEGTCKSCKRWYWCANSWNWVPWLSDLELVRTILPAIPIRHVIVDGEKPGEAVLVVHADTKQWYTNGVARGTT